jgi:ferritin
MLINEKLLDALNEQIGWEFFADKQYLAMAIYFEERGLSNLAKFFYAQADEERAHGLKIIKHIVDAGGKPQVPALNAPKGAFSSAEEVAQLFVDQEHEVTKSFYKMADMALAEKDYMTFNFLQWFIEEQLEEEASAGHLLQLVKMAGEERIFQVEMTVAHGE